MTNTADASDATTPGKSQRRTPTDLRAAIRRAVETDTLRRDPSAKSDATVKPPRPRLALRVGLTGHRPGRLSEAATKLSMSLAEHETWLAGKLEQVFAAIENGVCFARDAHQFGPDDNKQRFYDDREPPLIRLVTGLALGTDTIGVNLVDDRFRGDELEPSNDLIHIRQSHQSRPKNSPIEWQIDAILPFPATDFAFDAIEDFAFHHRGACGEAASDETLEADFHAHWRKIFAIPDNTLITPTTWRSGKPPLNPDPKLAHRIGVLQKEETREALARHHGAVAEPPDVPGEDRKDLRLDYALAGEFVLRQIDLLVAVWDGEPARGVGGAPDLVADAIDRGLPVVYIDCDARDAPPRMVYAVERMETGSAVVGWHPIPKRPVPEHADACVAALRDSILKITAPPAGAAIHGHKQARDNAERTIDFLEEEWPIVATPAVYRTFQDIVREPGLGSCGRFLARCFRRSAAVPDRQKHHSEKQWRDFINDDPDEGLQAVRLKRILHRRYVVADLLAVKYADLYRGAFIKSYLLAALAVTIAIVGLVLPEGDLNVISKVALVTLELCVVLAIQIIISRGEKGHWHEKFIHYRGLAESLRHLRFLATFAEFAETSGPTLSGETPWWIWYLRATAREIGLPQGDLGPTYQRSLLSILKSYEIADQIRYHEITAARESETDHAVHSLGNLLFAATAVILFVALAVFAGALCCTLAKIGVKEFTLSVALKLLHEHFPWLQYLKLGVGAFAAVLPTVGAALAGIRFTADFDGKATRSYAMKYDLHQISVTIDRAIKKQDFTTTRAALLEAASVMAEDVAAFQSLYGRKPLILPG